MTNLLTQALALIVDVLHTFIDFIFSTDHPGFVGISIGAVMVGIFMIVSGFDYLDFFLGSNHVRGDTKK